MTSAARLLRLGTRGSDLALTQSNTIADQLRSMERRVELVVIRTSGDESDAPSFAAIGPQGVFVREIEKALLAGEVDFAVHSLKDLPTSSPEGLTVAAVPKRLDSADVLLINDEAVNDATDDWLRLNTHASVGTSSARRRAWLKHFRNDLDISPLRGNVPTRIRHLRERRFDAIVLAAAGIERLEQAGKLPAEMLANVTPVKLDPNRFVAAPAQGALAVQCRQDDADVCALLAAIDHPTSRAAVTAERDALAEAEGGCEIAFGAHCARVRNGFRLTVMLERDAHTRAAAVEAAEPTTLGHAAWVALDEAFA